MPYAPSNYDALRSGEAAIYRQEKRLSTTTKVVGLMGLGTLFVAGIATYYARKAQSSASQLSPELASLQKEVSPLSSAYSSIEQQLTAIQKGQAAQTQYLQQIPSLSSQLSAIDLQSVSNGNAIAALQKEIAPIITPLDNMIASYNKILPTLENLPSLFSSTLSNLEKYIPVALAGFGADLSTYIPISALESDVGSVIKQSQALSAQLSQQAGQILNAVTGIPADVQDIKGYVQQTIYPYLQQMYGNLTTLKNNFSGLPTTIENNIKSGLAPEFNSLAGDISPITSTIQGYINPLKNTLNNSVVPSLGSIQTNVGNILGSIGSIFGL